jgi:hypothetical protein
MNMPGFTASSSLLQKSKSYYSIGRSALTAGSVYPASCNWECYSYLSAFCPSYCSDLHGREYFQCKQSCYADSRRDCGC